MRKLPFERLECRTMRYDHIKMPAIDGNQLRVITRLACSLAVLDGGFHANHVILVALNDDLVDSQRQTLDGRGLGIAGSVRARAAAE